MIKMRNTSFSVERKISLVLGLKTSGSLIEVNAISEYFPFRHKTISHYHNFYFKINIITCRGVEIAKFDTCPGTMDIMYLSERTGNPPKANSLSSTSCSETIY